MPDTNLHPGKLQQQLLFAGLFAGVNDANDTKEQLYKALFLNTLKHNKPLLLITFESESFKRNINYV